VPEVEEVIQNLVDKLVSQGLRFTAQVIPFEYYNITQFQLAKMTKTKGLFVKKSFNCLIDAIRIGENPSISICLIKLTTLNAKYLKV